MIQDIAVSVVCNTYNHEKYIKNALEGFLMQKTNFNYEVLIHDDASTDATADIIREYEKKYPDIIKPIYQTENQYSQSVRIGPNFQFPRAKGKYIAFCEGDDYWTDEHKLQKQFDALELHPEIDICAHSSNMVEAETKNIIGKIAPCNSDTIFSVEDVISGGGGFVATNSLFYRKELNDTIPKFRQYLMLDYALQIQGSLRNGMLYLKDYMSDYRYNSTNSWTSTMRTNIEKRYEHINKFIRMCEILDEETGYKYTEFITKHTLPYKTELLYIKRLKKLKFTGDDLRLFVFSISFKWKIKILLANCLKLLRNARKFIGLIQKK